MLNLKNTFTRVKTAADGLCTKAAVGALIAVSSAGAMAQAVDPFETAITTATTKVGAYAAALVGLSAVAVVFMIAMKYVKRIPNAS